MNLPFAGHRRTLALLLSLALSLGLLIFLLHALDWASFRREIDKVHVGYIPALLLLLVGIMAVRTLRWQELLPEAGRRSFRDLFEATLLGFFASSVLPLRAGELVRPWALTRWQPIPLATALASIIAERLWDGLTLLTLLGFTLWHLEQVPPAVQVGVRALVAICVVLLPAVLACYLAPDLIPRKTGALLRRLIPRRATLADRIEQALHRFVGGLRVVAGPWHATRVALLSLSLWLLMALWYQIGLWAFGEYPDWRMGMLLNLMISMAIAAPSAPGFIGTFQAGCILALCVMGGYSREFAVAYSVITHVLQMGLVLFAGFLVLQMRGLRFSQLRSGRESA